MNKVAKYRKAVVAATVAILELVALFVTIDPNVNQAIVAAVGDLAIVVGVVLAAND